MTEENSSFITDSFYVFRRIDIINKDFERIDSIKITLDDLVQQGIALTNQHINFHEIVYCDCREYNIKIKVINNLINTLQEARQELEEIRQETQSNSQTTEIISNDNSQINNNNNNPQN